MNRIVSDRSAKTNPRKDSKTSSETSPKRRRAGSWLSLAAMAGALVAAACSSDPAKPPPTADSLDGRLSAFSLEDQHGQTHAVDASTRLIFYSRDMDGGDVVKQVLEPLGDDFLASRHAVYIADISRMPGFISKTIAIPRMRNRSYSTLLDLEGLLTSKLPSQQGKATVLRLDDLQILDIQYVGSSEELRNILGL